MGTGWSTSPPRFIPNPRITCILIWAKRKKKLTQVFLSEMQCQGKNVSRNKKIRERVKVFIKYCWLLPVSFFRIIKTSPGTGSAAPGRPRALALPVPASRPLALPAPRCSHRTAWNVLLELGAPQLLQRLDNASSGLPHIISINTLALQAHQR